MDSDPSDGHLKEGVGYGGTPLDEPLLHGPVHQVEVPLDVWMNENSEESMYTDCCLHPRDNVSEDRIPEEEIVCPP